MILTEYRKINYSDSIESKPRSIAILMVVSMILAFLIFSSREAHAQEWQNMQQDYGDGWDCSNLDARIPEPVYDTCKKCLANGDTFFASTPIGASVVNPMWESYQGKCEAAFKPDTTPEPPPEMASPSASDLNIAPDEASQDNSTVSAPILDAPAQDPYAGTTSDASKSETPPNPDPHLLSDYSCFYPYAGMCVLQQINNWVDIIFPPTK